VSLSLSKGKAKKDFDCSTELPPAGLSVRAALINNLLFTDSGRTLLDIIVIGVDSIEAGLTSQRCTQEGTGVQLIKLVRTALVLVNRLLAAWPEGAGASPLVTALATRPANRTERHMLATVAQYAYHRHDPRLPTQATLLLKNIAAVSLLAQYS